MGMGIGLIVLIVLALLALASLAPAMADVENRGIPGPQDANLELQASTTKTADFNGSGLDLGDGFDPGGAGRAMAAVVDVTALDLTSTDETYAFTLQHSDDNSSFSACGAAVSVTATGVKSVPGLVSKRYVRLALDVGGTTPSITFSAKLNPLVNA